MFLEWKVHPKEFFDDVRFVGCFPFHSNLMFLYFMSFDPWVVVFYFWSSTYNHSFTEAEPYTSTNLKWVLSTFVEVFLYFVYLINKNKDKKLTLLFRKSHRKLYNSFTSFHFYWHVPHLNLLSYEYFVILYLSINKYSVLVIIVI